MFRTLVIFGMLFIPNITTTSADEKTDQAKESMKLQGTWKIISVEFSGKAVEAKDAGIDRIVVAGNHMTLMNGDKKVAKYDFELNPDRKPKGMLWEKEMKKGFLPLIYEVDSVKLKLCFPMLGTEEPKEAPKPPMGFETKDKPFGLIIAEKQKQ